MVAILPVKRGLKNFSFGDKVYENGIKTARLFPEANSTLFTQLFPSVTQMGEVEFGA
jgi:hypothetical protein